MISFQVVETFTAAPLNMVSGISDLELVVQGGKVLLYTATRAGGGVLAPTTDNPRLSGGGGTPTPLLADVIGSNFGTDQSP